MHGTKATLSAGNGKTSAEGQRFRKQLFTGGFFPCFYCGEIMQKWGAHIIFSLSRTSVNIYTNNEVLIGEGESRRQTSRPTAKSMA